MHSTQLLSIDGQVVMGGPFENMSLWSSIVNNNGPSMHVLYDYMCYNVCNDIL